MPHPADPRLHSPVLSMLFKAVESAIDIELQDIELPRELSARVRRRAMNRLVWGHPEGYQSSTRGAHYDQVIIDEVAHVGGLLGAEVVRELADQGVLQGPAQSGPQGPLTVVPPPKVVEELTIVTGPNEKAIREWADANGYRNVMPVTPSTTHRLRGLSGDMRIVVLPGLDEYTENVLASGGHRLLRV